MTRIWIVFAAIMGMLGVALGAFGAHGLGDLLAANGRGATFDTATQYLQVHALALLAVTLLSDRLKQTGLIRAAGWLMVIGTIIFSGSLYILSIFDLGFMGAIAPIGGTSLIIGWICLAASAWRAGPR